MGVSSTQAQGSVTYRPTSIDFTGTEGGLVIVTEFGTHTYDNNPIVTATIVGSELYVSVNSVILYIFSLSATITIASVAFSGTLAELKTQLEDDVFPALVPASSYKVWAGIVTQDGTDAPTAIVLQNTLGGDIVWSRFGAGDYLLTLAGAFTVGKTFILGFSNANSNGFSAMPIFNNFSGPSLAGYYQITVLNHANALNMLCYDTESPANNVDLGTLTGPNSGAFTGFFIEIRVYP